jgi:hypothetical protein
MAKFLSKPTTIEATQWFPGVSVPGVRVESEPFVNGGELLSAHVVTVNGQKADLYPGDWVIADPDGRHSSPCRPEVFSARYEPLTDG